MLKPPPNRPPSTLLGIQQGAVRGASMAQNATDAKQNFGQGHGHSMFSEIPLMGHAMSGTQLGQADNATRDAHSTLSRFRFADGGSVKPKGPSLKERKSIRAMIERGKSDAVDTLRESRDALLDAQATQQQQTSPDFTASLDKLRDRLATPAAPAMMADGGAVESDADSDPTAAQPMNADPSMLYQEYMELLEALQKTDLDQGTQMQLVSRLADIESQLESVGIDVGSGQSPE